MKPGLGCLALSLLMASTGLAIFVGQGLKTDSDSAIVLFHGRFNDGKFDAIWNDAHPKFRDAFTTKSNYSNYLQAAQKKFGKVKSSRQVRFTWFGTKEITQRTTFEHGDGIETFTFEWRPFKVSISGYSVAAE